MDEPARTVERLEALVALGFRRADVSPIPPTTVLVPGGRHGISSSRPCMGTLVTVMALHPSRALAEEAVGRSFEEMARVVDLLSRHDPASAVSALNGAGILRGPPPELSRVLGEALRCSRLTGGAFDPTVQPLVDRLRAARGARRDGAPRSPASHAPGMPTGTELQGLLELVDVRAVHLAPRAIRLRKSGMGVTLDGIAKGYVVDRMADVLKGFGVEDFLVNAGGDIRAAGSRADGRPWRVGIQDPTKRGPFPDVITLPHGAVATSGSYEIRLDPDGIHHHIVDAERGTSPRHATSVSVVAPTAMEADALATSVFLMEPRAASAFIASLPQCACLIVDRHGRQFRSARWRSAGTPPTPQEGTPWQA